MKFVAAEINDKAESARWIRRYVWREVKTRFEERDADSVRRRRTCFYGSTRRKRGRFVSRRLQACNKEISMECNEREGKSRRLYIERVLGHDQDRVPRKTDREGKGGVAEVEENQRKSETEAGASCSRVQDRCTDVRTDEGGIEL